jgi:hypothetical protein
MRKERQIINTNIRLNLCDEQDRQAWEYLQTMDRKKYKSYTRAVVVSLNEYFSREYRNETDPYLESREKEDAFLERVETAIREGVKESVPMAMAKNLLEILTPFVKELSGRESLSDMSIMMDKSGEDRKDGDLDWEKEEDMDAALDFADSF